VARSISGTAAVADSAINDRLLSGIDTKNLISNTGNNNKPRVLSGIQPTGELHLGNYLGALRQWVTNQHRFDNYFCVVDLHAITAPHDAAKLADNTRQVAALYLACGLDPAQNRIFVQSHVRAHAELAWLLNCVTPMSWLERMTQFKDKSKKLASSSTNDDEDGGTNHTTAIGVGLFGYPVLMAADILLYQASLVPVGDDQRQHLELTRDIARRFNDLYCSSGGVSDKKHKKKPTDGPVFTIPEAMIPEASAGARVMSLQDGTSKMSKSDPNAGSRIGILDAPDDIVRKIKRAKTDSIRGISFGEREDRPECANLLGIYMAVSGKSPEEVMQECGDTGWGTFKPLLAEAVVEHLAPIQARYREVDGSDELAQVLADGAEAANEVAETTLDQVKEAMGLLEKC
jgi:tryptophanyl-tRNA synthetase